MNIALALLNPNMILFYDGEFFMNDVCRDFGTTLVGSLQFWRRYVPNQQYTKP